MLGMVDAKRSVEGGQPELGRVGVEGAQPLDLLASQDVANIIAQVARGDSLTGGIVRIVGSGDVGRMRDALVSRQPERLGVSR